MTSYYLLDNPNPNCRWRGDGRYWGYQGRNQAPSGLIVGHTTETPVRYATPDMNADNTAAYFTHSSRPASYHTIVDSDSTVKCLPYTHTAFHCARSGINSHSIGLSMGYQAHLWGGIEDWEQKIIGRFAIECIEAMDWLKDDYGIDVPLRTVTAQQADAKWAGFCSHGTLQIDRSDPWNNHDEWWNRVFEAIHFFRNLADPSIPVPTEDDDMYIIYAQNPSDKKWTPNAIWNGGGTRERLTDEVMVALFGENWASSPRRKQVPYDWYMGLTAVASTGI